MWAVAVVQTILAIFSARLCITQCVLRDGIFPIVSWPVFLSIWKLANMWPLKKLFVSSYVYVYIYVYPSSGSCSAPTYISILVLVSVTKTAEDKFAFWLWRVLQINQRLSLILRKWRFFQMQANTCCTLLNEPCQSNPPAKVIIYVYRTDHRGIVLTGESGVWDADWWPGSNLSAPKLHSLTL